jgi:hypothetical protein
MISAAPSRLSWGDSLFYPVHAQTAPARFRYHDPDMKRRDLLRSALALPLATSMPASASPATPATGRAVWTAHLDRVARPVLENLAHGRLKASMPIESKPATAATRPHTTHLEAFARLLSGIAPWLEQTPSPEPELHAQYVVWTHAALEQALDPKSPDALEFAADNQNLVDAAFLSLAILRAPTVLHQSLSATTRKRLADALRATRVLQANYNNWLLFAACNEAALAALGEPWDHMRVDYALRQHMAWYLGDGTYGDGPQFHWDFYNSYVIHPFLLAILDAVGDRNPAWQAFHAQQQERATRYAHMQERMIAPDGSYPPLGRSITYRCGAFQCLADMALRQQLPPDLSPGQVRCALAAVIGRTLSPPATFDTQGWLRIGLAGHQPALGETYISTGSLYLCANAFLPLGLPEQAPFWASPDAPWTSQRIWAGADVAADHALDGSGNPPTAAPIRH